MRAHHVVMLALLCGCAAALPPPTPFVHGEATRRALAMQILDPDSSRSRQPVSGMDGRSAAAAQQRYEKSFSDAQHEAVPIVAGK